VSCTVAALLNVAVTKLIFKGTPSWQECSCRKNPAAQAEGWS